MKKYFLFSLLLMGALLYTSQSRRIPVAIPGQIGGYRPTPQPSSTRSTTNSSAGTSAGTTRTISTSVSTGIPATTTASTVSTPVPAPAATPALLPPTGVTSLDVINQSGNSVILYALNSNSEPRLLQNIPSNSISTITLPAGTVSVYVNETINCPPLALGNSMQGVLIQQSSTTLGQYALQLLTPTFNNNYITIYNQSPNQNTAILELTLPRTGISSWISSTEKRTFSKTLQPNGTYIMEIPNITTINSDGTITTNTPTQINFSVPTSSITTPFTLQTTTYNSFVITSDNNLIQN